MTSNANYAAIEPRKRGGPLVMLVVLLGVWITGRAALWENPFDIDGLQAATSELLLADASDGQPVPIERETSVAVSAPAGSDFGSIALWQSGAAGTLGNTPRAGLPVSVAAGHQLLMLAAFSSDRLGSPASGSFGLAPLGLQREEDRFAQPPFAAPRSNSRDDLDRWSLDAWAFFREGSNATLISQGRVPIYGASQVGSNLQYRIAPGDERDPRAFVRAYRALVNNGESEVAAGFSIRPVPSVPVRLATELRVTDSPFRTETRPAAYAITEIPPISLPADFTAEIYAGAGYVGGEAATPFVDGQVTAMRQVAEFEGPLETPARLSLGAGAWGGAQEDAHRFDLGPTVRLDLNVGNVPARFSIDWREQVAGDAAPSSGVAATLSTRF